jgi:hypothetical protein
MTSEQLDLFCVPADTAGPLLFQMACHRCTPTRIIAVEPVEAPDNPTGQWDFTEKWGYLAYLTHLDQEHGGR